MQVPRSLDELLVDLSLAYRVDDRTKIEEDLKGILHELQVLSLVEAAGNAAGTVPNPSGTEGRSQAFVSDQPPRYGPPRVRVMNESEVLAEFQVTSAGVTWWVM